MSKNTKRPEHTAPPELFYNDAEARKYTTNSRMIQIQYELTRRCVELLSLPDGVPGYLLDIGCGSCLSGEELSTDGHTWVGCDISPSMLEVAREREVDGDLMQHDMGHGLPFRPGTFDGVVSVSALQWILNADKSCHNPRSRMTRFFTTLIGCMGRGARAVFQFYPENPEQMQLITTYAMKAGFSGGIVVDYPNSTRAKKTYLCLFTGACEMPQPKMEGEGRFDKQSSANFTQSERQQFKGKKGSKAARPSKHSREWVLSKKERRRRQLSTKKSGSGNVRPDTKFTGRKRGPRF